MSKTCWNVCLPSKFTFATGTNKLRCTESGYSSDIIFTARKRSLGQGNIFTPVCHSVHRGGGHVWLLRGVHGCGGGMCGCWGACMVAGGHVWLPGGHVWLLGGMRGGGNAWLLGVGACMLARGQDTVN